MDVNEFNNRVKQFISAVQNDWPVINARLATSAWSAVKDRIINEGVDARGKSFGKYSTNPLPSYFFIGKALGSGAEKKMDSELRRQRKAGVKNPGISYEQWRDINNLQTNHVDMKFSGDTLKDIDVLETQRRGGVVTTIVASKDSITKKNGKSTVTTGQITDYLADRYGDFLQLSEQEEQVIAEAFDEELQELINKTIER